MWSSTVPRLCCAPHIEYIITISETHILSYKIGSTFPVIKHAIFSISVSFLGGYYKNELNLQNRKEMKERFGPS
jgi:hypothetical protein